MAGRAVTLVGSMPAKAEIDTSTYSGRVAARLRALRESHGWTVADLRRHINARLPKEQQLAVSTAHSWDNGTRTIDPDFYPLLARLFGLTVRKFLPAK